MTPVTAADLAAEVAAYAETQSHAPLPVVALHVDDGGGAPVVRGRVLTSKQAHAVGEIAGSHGASTELDVLGDPAARLEQSWLMITAPAIELWRDPASIGEDAARQTEYIAGDGHLRLLGRGEGTLLVQGPDLTIGWVPQVNLAPTNSDASREEFERRVRAIPDAAVLPDEALLRLHADLRARLVDAGRQAIGTPYRWGGTSSHGYDCSGLVQRLFSLTTGVLLPKHTGDQRHVGMRIPDGKAAAGDLLFATPVDQKVGHVMLVTGSDTVLHACLSEQQVIEESLDDNRRRYQHQGYRRPVQFDT
ncbi:MAG: hypothetical protein QOE92_1731 [Chloroflexota bacterium]|jgi:cell wall-associated NlpC family hydrolase|nr:hypothetical protein [Chloroflexota bacterium]